VKEWNLGKGGVRYRRGDKGWKRNGSEKAWSSCRRWAVIRRPGQRRQTCWKGEFIEGKRRSIWWGDMILLPQPGHWTSGKKGQERRPEGGLRGIIDKGRRRQKKGNCLSVEV